MSALSLVRRSRTLSFFILILILILILIFFLGCLGCLSCFFLAKTTRGLFFCISVPKWGAALFPVVLLALKKFLILVFVPVGLLFKRWEKEPFIAGELRDLPCPCIFQQGHEKSPLLSVAQRFKSLFVAQKKLDVRYSQSNDHLPLKRKAILGGHIRIGQ